MTRRDHQPVATFVLFAIMVIVVVSCIAGCSTPVPVIAKFPDVPTELLEKCPQLKVIEGETTTFSKLSETVNSNYAQYYLCSNKADSWAEWYNTQKKIYESVEAQGSILKGLRSISPIEDKLAKQFTNWVFTKVDVDLVSDAAELYQVSCMPTFVFIKNGQVVGRVEGANINNVLSLLYRYFILLIIIAAVIAIPVTFLGIRKSQP